MSTTPATVIEHGDPLDDGRAFRRCLGQFATGVTVVTTANGEKLSGMTVNSFSSVSIDPALVLWSIRTESASLKAFTETDSFVINVLSDEQVDHCKVFGAPSDTQFNEVEWEKGIHGDPILTGAVAHFECTMHQVIEAGDHFIIIGDVKNFTRFAGTPLLFAQGQFGLPAPFPSKRDAETAQNESAQTSAEDAPIFLTLLKTADQKLSQDFIEFREQNKIEMPLARVLNTLAVSPVNVDQLCRRSYLGENTVEDALIQLSSEGLVQVEDGKWALTDSGREFQIGLRTSAEEFNAKKLEGISEEDIESAKKVLHALIGKDA